MAPDELRLWLFVVSCAMLAVGSLRVWYLRRVRRRRTEAELRRRHRAWVARQEQAERERSAAQAAETARAEQQAVAQQALHIADEIAGGLAHFNRTHAAATTAPPARSPEAVSAVGRTRAETIYGHAAGHVHGTAETTPAQCAAKPTRTPEAAVRSSVYEVIKVDREGWRRWRGSVDRKGYPRVWLRVERKWTQAYRLVYRWEQGLIPKGWTIDHACGLKDCMDHLECVTRAENSRRRQARERGLLPIGHAGMSPPRRAA